MYDCTDCTLTLQHHDTKPRVACVTERYLTLTQHHTTSNTGSATCGLTLPYRTMSNTVSHEGPSIWHSCSLTPTTQTPRRGGGRTESSFKLKKKNRHILSSMDIVENNLRVAVITDSDDQADDRSDDEDGSCLWTLTQQSQQWPLRSHSGS